MTKICEKLNHPIQEFLKAHINKNLDLQNTSDDARSVWVIATPNQVGALKFKFRVAHALITTLTRWEILHRQENNFLFQSEAICRLGSSSWS